MCLRQVNKPAQLDKWKDITSKEMRAYFGLCIIMGINSLPRIAMYSSSDSFITICEFRMLWWKTGLKRSANSFISVIVHANHKEDMQIMVACSKFREFFGSSWKHSSCLSALKESLCRSRNDCTQRPIIVQTVYACQANKIQHQSVDGRRLCYCIYGKLFCLPLERGKWRSC